MSALQAKFVQKLNEGFLSRAKFDFPWSSLFRLSIFNFTDKSNDMNPAWTREVQQSHKWNSTCLMVAWHVVWIYLSVVLVLVFSELATLAKQFFHNSVLIFTVLSKSRRQNIIMTKQEARVESQSSNCLNQLAMSCMAAVSLWILKLWPWVFLNLDPPDTEKKTLRVEFA